MLGFDELVHGPASPAHARWDPQPVVDGSLMIRAADAGCPHVPEAVTRGHQSVSLYPGLEKSKYTRYRENWELLR